MKKSVWIYFFAALLLLLIGGSRVMASRGFRNNNPGNVRPLSGGRKWIGQTGVDYAGSKEGYVIFDSMQNGFRAMARDLQVKINRGLNTIEKIIPVYAPAADNNNVGAYILAVSKNSGIAHNKPIAREDLSKIVAAMARHELGAESFALVSMSDIEKGVARS